MFETFFKRKHIVDNQSSFDAQFFEDTNTLYKSIIDHEFTNANENKDKFQHSSALYNPISEQEFRSTIKDNKSAAGSLDNCKVHPLMLKHLDSDAIYALTNLFNLVLETANGFGTRQTKSSSRKRAKTRIANLVHIDQYQYLLIYASFSKKFLFAGLISIC